MVRMPDTEWFWAHVLNSMWALTIEDNWEKAGTVDVIDALYSSNDVTESFQSMVGTIFLVAWADIPEGFLVCDGTVYARGDYPALYDVLDAVFIIDSDNFNVPELSGRVAIGESAGFAIGETGGEIEHTLTSSEMPSHNHSDAGHLHALAGEVPGLALSPGELPVDVPGSTETTALGYASIQNTGGGNPHNNMQPYSTLRYVITAR